MINTRTLILLDNTNIPIFLKTIHKIVMSLENIKKGMKNNLKSYQGRNYDSSLLTCTSEI